MSRTRRLVAFIGAPGVGKGTFASILCKELGWAHFNVGAVMRDHVSSGSAMGLRIKDDLASGKLLADALVNDLAEEHIAKTLGVTGGTGAGASVLVDGYPRTVAQAEHLLSIGARAGASVQAVHIALERWVCVEKLLARRECATCRRGFNSAHIVTGGFHMPAILPDEHSCPLGPGACRPDLRERSDDTRDTIERRFEAFYEQTTPVLDVFRRGGGGGGGKLQEFTVTKGVDDAPALIALLQRSG